MSIQKKSLVGSRPAEKKGPVKPLKTETIGEPKGLTASALERRSFMKQAKKGNFNTLKGRT